MPYKITGKILDESGYPLYQIAQISEVSNQPGATVSANVWTDEETGSFTFLALDAANMIKVESIGYEPVSYKASAFPPVIKLQPVADLVINGTTTKKKSDNTLLWVVGGVFAAIAISVAMKRKPSKRTTPQKVKALPKPITVTV